MIPHWLRLLRVRSLSSRWFHFEKQQRVKLQLEELESRVVPTTYTVVNTADAGAGSLRQAILDANVNGGADVINFSIGSGQQTISPLSALPTISDAVTIDGTTQPGFAGTPIIEVSGASAGATTDGFTITASNSVIRGLVINAFDGNGILITGAGATSNVIQGNYIGTNVAGTADLGNAATGIRLDLSTSGNIIGGTNAGEGNLISGNNSYGIYVRTATNTTIAGNYIGTNAAGAGAIGNSSEGIRIESGTTTTIGALTATPGTAGGNVISGNAIAGVSIVGGTNNTLVGNLIGTNVAGTAAVANASGVLLASSTSNNTIGGTAAGAGNVISGNTASGVILRLSAHDNFVQGNLIGTDINGTAALGNGGGGVLVELSAHDNTVGGTTAAARNVISGNAADGVRIRGSGTDSNIVAGNNIGVDSTFVVKLGNQGSGIRIDSGASNNVVGASGNFGLGGNLIGGNTGDGITIDGVGTAGNQVIAFNLIGLTSSGSPIDLGNVGDGIRISGGASGNTVGSISSERNTIGFNAGSGVVITGSGTNNNVVQGNYVGTNENGDGAAANANGILISAGAQGNRIGSNADGSSDASEINLIAGNTGVGVWITGSGTTGNTVAGNLVGAGSAGGVMGRVAVPNATGVQIDAGASGNTIGGTTAAARNVISGNASDGVKIDGSGTNSNIVEGNYVGTDYRGDGLIPNTVAWYKGESTAAPTVGAITGTITGNVTFTAGEVGQAFTFDGGAAVVTLTGSVTGPLDITGTDLTVEAWVNQANASQGNNAFNTQTVIDKYFSGGHNGYLLQVTNGIPELVLATTSVAPFVLSAPSAISLNTWTHLAATYDGTTARLYVNGVEVASAALTGTILHNSFDATIGNDNGGPNYGFKGSIDEVGVYSRALRPTEIASIVGYGLFGKASDLGNSGSGITVTGGATGNTVGGTTAGARNVISDNSSFGVNISGAGTSGNTVAGNYIGTDAAGAAARPNGGVFEGGVIIQSGASGNTIGGTVAGSRNVISGNTWGGVEISAASANTVVGNYIGTDAAGAAALGNSYGVWLVGAATNNTIGGGTAAARNVISGNVKGVAIEQSGTSANKVQGNWIGLNAAGTAALPNTNNAVQLASGAQSNFIGTDSDGSNDASEGNVISGNTATGGVALFHTNTRFNRIAGNLIGLNPAGNAAMPNSIGVSLSFGASDNVIGSNADGTADDEERNVIAGNTAVGVSIGTAGTSGNTVAGNYLGTDVTGTALIVSGGRGVYIFGGATNNTVGGTTAAARNVINGSALGVDIAQLGTSGNVVLGNYIGTDKTGAAALGNSTGVRLSDQATNNTIGGTTAAARNVISGNAGTGIDVRDAGTINNVIFANYVGTNEAGSAALGNAFHGIRISGGADRTTIGGPTLGERNVISGNLGSDITISGGTLGNTIVNNVIGLDADGHAALSSSGDEGIYLIDSPNNVIGAADGTHNVLSGHGDAGIYLEGPGTINTTIVGNWIGLDIDGSNVNLVGNGSGGIIFADGASFNTVGGPTAAHRNVIAGHDQSVVSAGIVFLVVNSAADDITNNVILNNWIGLDAAGNAAPNYYGIQVSAFSHDNTIGSTTAGLGNVISGNSAAGILFNSDAFVGDGPANAPHGNVVVGNRIGTDATGTLAMPNATGVSITAGAHDNTIGGASVGARNVISGNSGEGVQITGSGTAGNVVLGNYVGLSAAGDGQTGDATAWFRGESNLNDSLFGNDGTSSSITFTTGKVGQALSFDGVSQTIRVPNSAAVEPSSGVAVEGWVRSSSAFATGAVIVAKGSNGTTASYGLEVAAGGGLTFFVTQSGTTYRSPVASASLWDGTYHHVAGTADGHFVRLYIDGVEVGTGTSAPNVFPSYGLGVTNDLDLGSLGGTSLFFNGELDELGVYRRWLRPEEIAGIAARGSAGKPEYLGNLGQGVSIGGGATNTTVGGVGAGNVISGNNDRGVYVVGAGTGTVIRDNSIGTNPAGTAAVGNIVGIYVYDSPAVQVIGNLITGNVYSGGLRIDGGGATPADGAVVQGNTFGLNAAGTANLGGGTIALTADDVTVGGTTVAARNVIVDGIAAASLDNLTVQGNYIGTNPSGTVNLAETVYGISVTSSTNVAIGGFTDTPGTGAGNVVNSTFIDIVLSGGTNPSTGTRVLGNVIGLNAAGTTDISAATDGIRIQSSVGTVIGGDDDDDGSLDGVVRARNVISGHAQYGVRLQDGAVDSIVQGNYLGTDITGTLDRGNGYYGVTSFTSDLSNQNNLIGGITPGAGNVISGNDTGGVEIYASAGNVVQGNRIGTNAAGTAALPNVGNGVVVLYSSNNKIGGPAGAGNLISGNVAGGFYGGADGAGVLDAFSSGTTISGNTVGLNAAGTAALANAGAGIVVHYSGDTSLDGNLVSANAGSGVVVEGNAVLQPDRAFGYWRANDTTTDAVYGVYGYTGTHSAAMPAEQFAPGVAGSGFLFDGVDDYFRDDPAIGTGRMSYTIGATVSAWVKTSDADGTIFSDGGGVDTEYGLGLFVEGGNLVARFSKGTAGQFNFVVVGPAINDNAFHQIAVTWDGTTAANAVKLYVDGAVVAQGTALQAGQSQPGSTLTHFGGHSTLALPFLAGVIDEVGEWAGALTPAEISSLHALGGLAQTTTGHTVIANTIGLNAAGTAQLRNLDSGLLLIDSPNNTIGGLIAATRNVISGNTTANVELRNPGSTNNLIVGNYIGTNAAGTAGVFTTNNGIYLNNAGGNTIGGTTAAARNVISGNTFEGVVAFGPGATNNTVAGNYIGTDAAGAAPIGNATGVRLFGGAHDNTIGGPTAGAGNVISGNTGDGVVVTGTGTDNNVIAGNLIGTNAAGGAAVGNALDGVYVAAGPLNTLIGGTTGASRNIISGNRNGIQLATVSSGTIQGNIIGLDVGGTIDLGNALSGIVFSAGANSVTIGGTTAAARNVISGNDGPGIYLLGGGSGSTIAGNYIGTDVTGTLARGNALRGIYVVTGQNVIIGSTTPGGGNVISGNAGDGIRFSQSGYAANLVVGNYIGTNAAGTADLGNAGAGVAIGGGSGNTIGGTVAGSRNVISGNDSVGVGLSGAGTTNNVVAGNYIGLNAAGTAAIGNSDTAVDITVQASGNLIGGSTPAARNVISGNAGGVRLNAFGGTGNKVQGNYIGTDYTGLVDLGNANGGVGVANGDGGNVIGTDGDGVNDAGEGNVIAGNDSDGVVLSGANLVANVVAGNLIGLGADGATPLPNLGTGVLLFAGSNNNRIGTNADGVNDTLERNVISGNTGNGVVVGGTGTGNVVAGNYIGTDISGTLSRGNTNSGVVLTNGATGVTIGGTTAAARNLISGNTSAGVVFTGPTTTANAVLSNYIGTNADGTAVLGNGGSGVYITNFAHDNAIGQAGAGNVISGNNYGVSNEGGGAGNTIRGNLIGTDKTGTVALGNNTGSSGSGFGHANIYTADPDTVIGGTLPGEGNVIAGSDGPGIWVRYTNAAGTRIEGNFIGTNAAGASGLGNATGIIASGTTGLTIGGTTAAARNVISGNAEKGIYLSDGTSDTVVQGNYIGTDPTGTAALGAHQYGVFVNGNLGADLNLTIGGPEAGAGNVIGGSSVAGVALVTDVTGVTIQGNKIGTDAAGTAAVANKDGVVVGVRSFGNLVTENLIAGNTGNGVVLTDTGTHDNIVSGNTIGLSGNGYSPLGNVGAGVRLQAGAADNTIGGTTPGAGNVIAYNGTAGVLLLDGTQLTNQARRNSIYSNAGLGIDVGGDGVTLNTTGTETNAPVLTLVRAGAGVVEVFGFAQPGKTIEFYLADNDASGFGEGRAYLATAVEGSAADTDSAVGAYGPGPVSGRVVGSDVAYRFHFTIPVPADFAVGDKITALTIGSVSEFAANAVADVTPAFGAPVVDAGEDAAILVGQEFSGKGSFSDLDSDSWTAVVDYGDGGGSQPLTLGPATFGNQDPDAYSRGVTVGFELKHTYSAAGTYSVTVSVRDDSGRVGIDSRTVTVAEAPPIVNNSNITVTPQKLNEGGSVTVTGTFDDSSTADSHTARILWGDGTQSFATVNEALGTFTATHTYLDDNPSNTASDVYALQAEITDITSLSSRTIYGLFFVTVDNVQPTGLSLTPNVTTIDEGGLMSLAGSFADPGVLDTHRVVITWGDGSADTVLNLGAGVTSFTNIAHLYKNNPAAPATSHAISVSVADDDEPLNPVTATTDITVRNVTPSNVVVLPSSTNVIENDTVVLGATFDDPGSLDAHTVLITWGDGSPVQTLTLAPGQLFFGGVTHRYLDNPAGQPHGSFTITVQIADTDEPTVFATGTRDVTVNNAAPTVPTMTVVPTTTVENESVTVTGTFADVGTLDRQTVTITWGDGTTSNASVDSTAHTFTASHRYLDDPIGAPDDYTITATVTDKDGDVGIATRTVTVNNAPPIARILPKGPQSLGSIVLTSEATDPGSQDILSYSWTVTPVGGGSPFTATGQDVSFSSAAGASFDVALTVTDGDGGVSTQTLRLQVLTEFDDAYAPAAPPSGVGILMVLGLAGDDVIDLSALSIPVVIDGNSGNDVLTGGSADDVIFLHQGNDSADGRGGDDRYLLTPNSTLTVEDGFGNNTLDFVQSSFGVTFDLSQSTGQVQDVLPSNPNLHFVSIDDLGTGQFGTLVGSTFGDNLTAASNSSIFAGTGADQLSVKSGTVNTTLAGGADADQLLVTGSGVANINFQGDDGADVLTNQGINVTNLTFTGGNDADVFTNVGTAATITFGGGSDADVFTNVGTAATITFGGGSDADVFQATAGSVATTINFQGDDGADRFTNDGSIATIAFTGGSDADVFTNTGSVTTTINFQGDDGADAFTNSGSIADITFTGGSDADVFTNAGTAATITFGGGSDADVFTNAGTAATITFTGGSDADVFQATAGSVVTTINFQGDDGADRFTNDGSVTTAITFTGGNDADVFTNAGTAATITFTGGSDADVFQATAGSVVTTINFQGDDGADRFTNAGSVVDITFIGGNDADVFTNAGTAATITFTGGSDADVFTNAGTAATITFGGGSDADVFTNTGSVTTTINFQGDDGADRFTNAGSIATITFTGGNDADVFTNAGTAATITFGGGSDADVFQATAGSVATTINFQGDDGADVFINEGSVANITFTGGNDADALLNAGSSIATINFQGDGGADLLVNRSAATVTFTGGSDADQMLNASSVASSINFQGDDGTDLFVNSGVASTVTFTGGNDADVFQTVAGSVATTINFQGDDGADQLVNNGSIGTITFTGGNDADVLLNNGTDVATINFQGDDGADVFVNNGNGAAGTAITFTGGAGTDAMQNNASLVGSIRFIGDAGGDVFQNNGSGVTIEFFGGSDADVFQNSTLASGVVSINFQGDDGADALINAGSVTDITFTGGNDADVFTNVGTAATITFGGGSDADVFQATAGSVATTINFQGDDGADVFINEGSVANITFTGGNDADALLNAGSSIATINFQGDGGADLLVNRSAATVTFTGGSDADQMLNASSVASSINFQGDDGADLFVNSGVAATVTFTGGNDADVFTNAGTATTITFTGGSDADVFTNTGSVTTAINFQGDDGADRLTNDGSIATVTFTGGNDADVFTNAGTAATITFTGGSDADVFQATAGSVATTISFQGDDGADRLTNDGTASTITFTGGNDADALLNAGSNIGSISFTGGAGGDSLTNTGNAVASLTFDGDDGSDTLDYSGQGGPNSSVVFNGGLGDDVFLWRGQADSITFDGGIGNDRVLYSGSNNATTLNGGLGSDSYLFSGAAQGNITIPETYAAGDPSRDVLDFSGYSVGITLDLARTTIQTVAAGLSLTLTDARGIEDAIGTSFGDTIFGNDLDNVLTGAVIADAAITAAPAWDGRTQWVYLDFDTETGPDEYVYSQAERDDIQARLEADFHPWFHVNFTRTQPAVPVYATEFFNKTPSFNRPGGEASELDFGNANLGGTTAIQANGLTGGANQPATNSQNVVALSAKIAAHELEHLLGVRHSDAFGPIGYGVHSPPGNDQFKPSFGGPQSAFESFSHLIGSPATIGSDRFNDLGDLYLGTREAVKLTFAESGTTANEQGASHGSRTLAQPITLAQLAVPNTDPSGVYSSSTLNVAALSVRGHIGLANNGHSESDFYSFTGRKGDLFSFEVVSMGLANNPSTIDSILRIYDAAGNLVPYFGGTAVNDDQFEPTDSLLLDVTLPTDGTYYVEVDTFARDPGDPLFDPGSPSSPLNPANTRSVFNPLSPNYDPTALADFLDTRDDTDIGDYQLFLYRFGASNKVDIGDTIHGGAGDDTIRGGIGGDSLQGDAGNDVIDPGDGSSPFTLPTPFTANEADLVTLAPSSSGSGTYTWQVSASNGQVIADGTSAGFSFTPNDNGVYTITYTTVGPQGDTSSDSTDVTVTNRPPTATLTAPSLAYADVSASFTLSATDPSSVDSNAGFTYLVNWGDGTTTVNPTANNGSGVTVTHTYNAVGNYTVTLTATDKDNGVSATTSTSVTVQVNNLPAEIEAGPDQAVNEGAVVSLTGATFSNPYSTGTHTATINWGDGTPVVAGTVTQSPSGGGVTGIIAGSHRYADNGGYTVTVTVTTPLGVTSSDSFTATVNNVAPTLSVLSGPPIVVSGAGMLIPGQAVAYTAAFTDPGFDNAANAGGEVAETFTGTFNWGDGTTSVATLSWLTGSPGVLTSGSAVMSHTYAAQGDYTVTLTLNDDDTGTATRTFAVKVTESAYLLATSGSGVLSVSGNGRVDLPGVIEVASNSSTAIKGTGNAEISAAQIHVVGGYSLSGNATISPTPITGGVAAADPLASLAAPSVAGTTDSVNLSGNSTLTIGPGRYSQIKVSGNAKLTMQPGVYVILGGGLSVSGNANLTGQGVTIYNAGSAYPSAGGSFGGISVTSNGTVNLTPPAVGQDYAGVLFFQARDNTRALAISGNGVLGIHGTIYAKAAQLVLSGGELKTPLVAHSMKVSGNASSTLVAEGAGGGAGLAQTLLGTDLWVYVDNGNNAFSGEGLARIDSAIAGLNGLLGTHSVLVTRVDSEDEANLVIDAATTTPWGGASDGVLGYYREALPRNEIILVQGWDWYVGAIASGIRSDQFDFQTIVTHELGHALGLGHSADTSSAMHAELNEGVVKRTITETDLNIPDAPGGDPVLAGSQSPRVPFAIGVPGVWGADIALVARFTPHEDKLTALDAALTEWASTRSYNDRVAKLTGGDGPDWFLLNLGPGTTDDAKEKKDSEVTTGIDLWTGTWPA